MRIIKAGYQFLTDESITKKIERVARICYKSEDKIGPGTDVKMLNNLIKRQHLAMLEHGDVCLDVSKNVYDLITDVINMMESIIRLGLEPKKCYLRRTEMYLCSGRTRYIVSGNMRAWYEFFLEAAKVEALPASVYDAVNEMMEHLFDNSPIKNYKIGINEDVWGACLVPYDCKVIKDMSKLSEEERMVHETVSILFTVDRGVTHELVRHRDCSFAQESTRYCDYVLGKHGSEIAVIEPCFYVDSGDEYNTWVSGMQDAEMYYFNLRGLGGSPQETRTTLPTSVKADIVMTTNLREWKHIFNLRACDFTGPSHPQMKEVMIPAFKEMRTLFPFAFKDMLAADEVHG